MQADKPAPATGAHARLRQSWPLLVSIFGVNLPLLGLLGLMSGHAGRSELAVIVPITLVELPERQEPEPEPEPEPAPPPQTVAPAPERPAPPSPQPEPSETDRPTLQSPILAAPGETADAVLPQAGADTDAEETTPALRQPAEQAITALQAFRCNRLGADRPVDCPDVEDAILPVTKPAFAEEPDMKPKAWADFEVPQQDLALARLLAEGCPPNDGVINDVFVPTDNPYLQGAGSMTGSLSANSAAPECG